MNLIPARTKLALLAAPVLLLGTSCSSSESSEPTRTDPDTPPPSLARVALLGDSVAAQLAAPLTEAMAASGVELVSLAQDGGGGVVGPVASLTWKTLPEQLEESGATTIVYQITSYDWGTPAEQRTAYERLVRTADDLDADLVFVTMPPLRPDDFYEPHLAELASTVAAARAAADGSEGRAHLLDAGEVWGDSYARERGGVVDRSSDGIHTCPQGAARFTAWLMSELAEIEEGFTPAEPEAWANTGWASDDRFVGCSSR